MILHRAICYNGNPIIPVIGVYWSRYPKSAYTIGCQLDINYYWLYTAEIEEKYIDAEQTTLANNEWPNEREVTIKPGSPIKILKIRKYKKPCQTLLEIINHQYNAIT